MLQKHSFTKFQIGISLKLQSELKSYNCTELWLLCSTAISATVIIVLFDEHIWNRIWDLTCALYEPDNPNIPT